MREEEDYESGEKRGIQEKTKKTGKRWEDGEAEKDEEYSR